MRMSPEELALQADVSLETLASYCDQGLLEAPQLDDGRVLFSAEDLETVARISDLRRRGFSWPLIRRFLAGELDPAEASLAEAVTSGFAPAGAPAWEGEDFDLEGLAERAGLPADMLASLVDEGLLVPESIKGQPRFTMSDVAALRSGLRLVEAGLPLEELLALARHHHHATREIADQAVDLFDTYVRKPVLAADLDEVTKAERLVGAFDELLPAVTALVTDHFRRLLLNAATERFESPTEHP